MTSHPTVPASPAVLWQCVFLFFISNGFPHGIALPAMCIAAAWPLSAKIVFWIPLTSSSCLPDVRCAHCVMPLCCIHDLHNRFLRCRTEFSEAKELQPSRGAALELTRGRPLGAAEAAQLSSYAADSWVIRLPLHLHLSHFSSRFSHSQQITTCSTLATANDVGH